MVGGSLGDMGGEVWSATPYKVDSVHKSAQD